MRNQWLIVLSAETADQSGRTGCVDNAPSRVLINVTTFDRYLLRRFLHVFLIGMFATYGLYVVFDGFTNIDGFQDAEQTRSATTILWMMVEYYAFQSLTFIAMTGPMLNVLAVMVVFALLQKNGELNPVLSAGVPTYRIAVPLIAGAVSVNIVLIINQEIVIPTIADRLMAPLGKDASSAQHVQPIYDFETNIHITGEKLFLSERKLQNAEFVLPAPSIAATLTTLRADEAHFVEEAPNQPAGWVLTHPEPRFEELELAEAGRQHVIGKADSGKIFVVTDISFDQLHDRNLTNQYLSTSELLNRIKNPAFSTLSVRSQILHLHGRFGQPIMNIIAVLLVVPLVVQKESTGLITNIAFCCGALVVAYASTQAFGYLGSVNVLSPDLAVWSPIILHGTCFAWISDWVQT